MFRTSLIPMLALLGAPLAAQQPLSAIEWLQDNPPAQVLPGALPGEAPVSEGAGTPDVEVIPLDAARPDSVGLLPSSVTGFPATLWQSSEQNRLIELIRGQRTNDVPAMRALLYTLLLAEAEPPLGAQEEGSFLLARIDMLMEMGAITPAEALLERAGTDTPPLFARWFDATLLTGAETLACRALKDQMHLAPDYMARVFCTARLGDWRAAAVTLETARVLNLLSKDQIALMERFLDPELFEGMPPLTPPTAPTPLEFRLFEANGEPIPTSGLPRAFAFSDLRGLSGWKPQIEAAERLARTGALSENRLMGIYTDRRPAASGGVWDRVAEVQRLDTALAAGDAAATARHLPLAFSAMASAGLSVPFSAFFAPLLKLVPLRDDAAKDKLTVELLSPGYEGAAQAHTPGSGFEQVLVGLATGNVGTLKSADATTQAVLDGFADTSPPQELVDMVKSGKLGEAILMAMSRFERGTRGDLPALSGALATFRAVGLEDTARRAALQVLLAGV